MAGSYLSRKGYEKLVTDLAKLKEHKRKLSKEIGEAAEKGDLRENAEYTYAKERQAEILRRIDEVERKIRTAQIIEELDIPKDEVRIGVKVTLQEKESGEELAYTLVGEEESDPLGGKISVFAPLAQGVLGHKMGDEVSVDLPAGRKTFKIVKTEPGD
ncbi:MAG: transcription elongation factor GreA [Elusimicrobia bacterium]|nr:transcription elongation factor GreA [Elusimicrobiota bacterium]